MTIFYPQEAESVQMFCVTIFNFKELSLHKSSKTFPLQFFTRVFSYKTSDQTMVQKKTVDVDEM